MPVEDNEEAARAEALRCFKEKADDFLTYLEETHHEMLPGNHAPADIVLLAYLMTATDGYKDVKIATDWNRLPKSGWETTLVYLPDLKAGVHADFGFEVRDDAHVRQLAVLVDHHRPGEPVPEKVENERKLTSLGFRVVRFTELEILSDPDECRVRVEGILMDMVDGNWEDAGVLQPRR